MVCLQGQEGIEAVQAFCGHGG